MIIEALVITTCLQQQGGCSESTSAYYQYNKEAQEFVINVEKFGKKVIQGHEWLIYVASPIYALATNQQVNFKLSNHLLFGLNPKKELVILQWSY